MRSRSFSSSRKRGWFLRAKATAVEDIGFLAPFNSFNIGEYRRSGHGAAVSVTRIRSVPKDRRIHFSGPGFDASAQRLRVLESLIAEPGSHIERSLSVVAENDEMLVGIEFLVSTARNVAHRHQQAALDAGCLNIPMVRGHR